jgi:uncharacterized membrane protein YphA (DoxX/SURF4 family)
MSFFNVSQDQTYKWKNYEKVALKFFFIYFVLQAVPIDCKFYKALWSIDWQHATFYGLFTLSRYAPQFFSFTGYINWAVAALIATVGTAVWIIAERKEPSYTNLLYWLRVLLRYRLAIAVIAYGFIKVFPLQMPYPSLSNLHTNYGDFLAWKIYYHTIGITPGYETFLGIIEIIAGLLLLNRKTVTFGAAIVVGFMSNVFAANLGYDVGEYVYSSYLLVIALFLFSYDAIRLFNLLILEKLTIASKFQPVFSNKTIRSLRLGVKIAVLVFIVSLGFSTYANYGNAPYKLPKAPGLKGAYGYYNVREFKLNGKVLPYSRTDSSRWQNVVFEKWATISIKVARPIKIDLGNGDEYHPEDIERNFESAGVGGRRYYAYTADTVHKTLWLTNKNKYYPTEKYSLNYSRPNDSTLVIRGINEKRDSVYAVLDRVNSKHLLFVGRRKPLKL